MKNKIKKLFSVLIAFSIIASVSILPKNELTSELFSETAVPVYAASLYVPKLGNNNYIVWIATQKTNVYTNSSFKKPGSSEDKSGKKVKEYNSYIDKGDQCYIYKLTSSYAFVKFPVGKKYRYGYIKTSAISSLKNTDTSITSKSAENTYSNSDLKTKIGSIAKNDMVYLLNMEKGNCQYIYPISNNNFKIGWVSEISYYNITGAKKYTGYVNTTTESLTLRDTPKANGKQLALMDRCSQVKVLDNKKKNNGFYHVIFKNKIGYALAQYISFTKVEPIVDPNYLLSQSEITSAAQKYNIKTDSNAYKCLNLINSKYSKSLKSNSSGTNVFLFEGVGNSSSKNKRMNAMCVVVKNQKIVYINLNSSTIPDDPFNPSKNGGRDMPTIKSGIYSFTTVNHHSNAYGDYAALNVTNAKVVRHHNKTSFYSETSPHINIHRRSANSINNSWVNSAGCIIIGTTPSSVNSSTSEYAKFIQSVGIVNSNDGGNHTYRHSVKGKVVVDRIYAEDYLKNIGYTTNAIDLLG